MNDNQSDIPVPWHTQSIESVIAVYGNADAQVAKMNERLDETSPKGVLRPLHDEIRKWIRAGK